jgi:hypothetical protein
MRSIRGLSSIDLPSLRSRPIGNSDPPSVDHVPALPAGEEQDADHDQREDKACRHYRRRSLHVTRKEIVYLDYDRNDVTAGMPPRMLPDQTRGSS